ncbi:Hypothetical protein PBC10988_27520 [Planctomycetales bacterium 10988]|nr:Hypothetical protein PBC10988_27520 [Planctomycetales bacterium 10988]
MKRPFFFSQVDGPQERRWIRAFAHFMHEVFESATQSNPANQSPPLLEWSRTYLPQHVCQAPSKMHRWFGTQLDLLLENRGKKLNVIAPRGGAKSTIGSLAFPLRCAVEGREPLIWILSETRDQACNHLENIRHELTENRALARSYPQACGRGTVWRAGRLILKNGAVLEAYGSGQKLRGRRQGAHRPSLMICDDLQSDQVIFSSKLREKDWDWFNGSLLKAGTKRSNVIHVATALHREAIAMRLLEHAGWTSRKFAAIEQWPARMDLWQRWAEIYQDLKREDSAADARLFYERHAEALHEGAELLWPEEEDLYTLMLMRENEGHRVFLREKQGVSVDVEACEWPEDYFEDSLWFDAYPSELHTKVIALDPSKGRDSRRGDYSAYASIAIGKDGLCYLDADLARRPTEQMIADGVALCRSFQPQAFGVESNHYQELLGNEFERVFHEEGIPLVPYLIENRSPKIVRIRTLSPWLAQRKLRFRRTPGMRLLVSQLRDFPDPQSHDDGPDALEMALRLAHHLLGSEEPPHDPLQGCERLPLI